MKFGITLFLLVLLWVTSAAAQLTFDATATSSCGACTSLTFSHTNSTSANRVLLVGVVADGGVTPSGTTYAAVAMTQIAQATQSGCNSSTLYGLIAPATGANNVVVSAGSSTILIGGTASFTGADQTSGWHNGTTARDPGGTCGASSAAPSMSVTSAAGEIVVDTVGWGIDVSGNPALTVGGGQTQMWQDRTQVDNSGGAGSREAGAASVTMSWTGTTGQSWVMTGVSAMAAATRRPGNPIIFQ